MSQVFQSTDLENFPNGWRSLHLYEVADLKNGYAFKSKDYVAYSNTLNVRMSNIRPGAQFDLEYSLKYLPDEYAEKHSGFLLDDGDLIIAMTDMANDPKILGVPTIIRGRSDRKLLLNQRVGKLVLFPGNKIEIEYLRFYLSQQEVQKFLIARAKKGVQVNIGKKDILSVPIHHPPLPEQKKVAHILSTVQRAIEAQERIIQATTELKKTLMHKLFTEGLRNEPQKQTEIGPVPESWEVAPLEAKAEAFQYGTSVKCGHDVDGKPVLRIPNVVGGHIDPKDLKFGKPKPNELGKLVLESGDLLFVRTNGVKENAGRCSKFSDELSDCYFASYLIRVRLDPSILNPDFINEYSRTEVGTSFLSGKAIRTADGKFNINSGTLKTMLVPVPSIDEQDKIAQILAIIDIKAENTQAKKAHIKDLFYTLLHELMTAKTRVANVDLDEVV